jgi:hypothetical protein
MAKPPAPRRPAVSAASTVSTEPATLEALYARYALEGLEPVLDVAERATHGALDDFLDVHCPFCGETYGLAVDLSGGERTFIEDCTVCCRPIELRLTLRADGSAAGLRAKRTG